MQLFTIGYEGTDIETFVEFLAKNKIRQIADVRKNPVSRKKGFSKNKLAEHLAKKKIDYIHLPTLGVPSAWRDSAKKHTITREKMFEKYAETILPKCKGEVLGLLDLAKDHRLALLCFEADAHDCHRHFLAEQMKQSAKETVTVKDLKLPVESYESNFRTLFKSK